MLVLFHRENKAITGNIHVYFIYFFFLVPLAYSYCLLSSVRLEYTVEAFVFCSSPSLVGVPNGHG